MPPPSWLLAAAAGPQLVDVALPSLSPSSSCGLPPTVCPVSMSQLPSWSGACLCQCDLILTNYISIDSFPNNVLF